MSWIIVYKLVKLQILMLMVTVFITLSEATLYSACTNQSDCKTIRDIFCYNRSSCQPCQEALCNRTIINNCKQFCKTYAEQNQLSTKLPNQPNNKNGSTGKDPPTSSQTKSAPSLYDQLFSKKPQSIMTSTPGTQPAYAAKTQVESERKEGGNSDQLMVIVVCAVLLVVIVAILALCVVMMYFMKFGFRQTLEMGTRNDSIEDQTKSLLRIERTDSSSSSYNSNETNDDKVSRSSSTTCHTEKEFIRRGTRMRHASTCTQSEDLSCDVVNTSSPSSPTTNDTQVPSLMSNNSDSKLSLAEDVLSSLKQHSSGLHQCIDEEPQHYSIAHPTSDTATLAFN